MTPFLWLVLFTVSATSYHYINKIIEDIKNSTSILEALKKSSKNLLIIFYCICTGIFFCVISMGGTFGTIE